MGYTSFELNCEYHLLVSYKKNINPRSRSKAADELTEKLKNLMAACKKNLQDVQELQKQAHNEGTKPKSYALSEKVLLNNKYIKTKRNWKLEAKFFGSFRVLHPMGSQAYKFELPKQWKIHNVFYVFLLEQDITRNGRIDKKIA